MVLNRTHSATLFVALAAFLLSLEAWFSRSGALAAAGQPETLALVVSVDILVGVPLLYYLLLARRSYAPTKGLVPLVVLSFVALRLILPAEQRSHLAPLEAVIPLIELAVFAFVAVRARTLVRHMRAARATEPYLSDRLRVGLRHTLGQSFAANLLANEMSIVYYVLAGPFTRYGPSRGDARFFSYHRHSGFIALVVVAFFMTVLEATVLHLLLMRWNSVVAWLVTVASVYGLVWLFGYFQSTRLEPIVVDGSYLHLRTGFLWRATVPLSDLVAVRRVAAADTRSPDYLNAAVFGDARLVVECREPVTVVDFLGRGRAVRLIGVTVDDEAAFQRLAAGPSDARPQTAG